MPSFNETKVAFLAARTSMDDILTAIAGKHYLGVNGYYVVIRIDVNSPKVIKVRVEGPDIDINKIPAKVLQNYMIVLKEIQEWKDGELPDFPDFSTRF